MGLYERITSNGEPGSPAKLSVHSFGAATREWARGNITRAQVIAGFNLDDTGDPGTDGVELDAIAAKYGALVGTEAKLNFLSLMEDAWILAESGHYDRDTVKDRLGFS